MTTDGSQERNPAERPLRERVHRKAFDRATEFFQKKLEQKGKSINPERVQDILYTFLERELETTQTFVSEKYGVSFIYAVVDAGSIAKRLFQQYRGALPPLEAQTSGTAHDEREFIFGSYASPHMPAALFPFFEQGLQQVIRELPQALADIKAGREPKRHEIYFVGSPTRDIGHVTPTFVESMKQRGAYEPFADIYSEFIGSVNRDANVDIKLRGISMGASFAVKTAEKLIASKQATQSRNEADTSGIPFMEVRLDNPVAQTTFSKTRRWWQMRAGFLFHSLWTFATDRYARVVSNPWSGFVRDISPILREKGIAAEMSREQARLKKEAANLLLSGMDEGVPIPSDVSVVEVIGLLDILTLSPKTSLGGFVKQLVAKLRGTSSDGAPTEKAVLLSEKGNRKTYGISHGHNFPNFPPRTVEDMYQADQALAHLQKEN